jgi:phosphoglycerate dehydrogenase-like enzyme
VPPELFARARNLRWICAARSGLGGAWFYDALVKSDVVVTNTRGSYKEHLAAHAVAFLLAFARRFDHYLPQKRWLRGPQMIDLPAKTVLIVGGGEVAKLCAAFGMRVIGIDPRVTEAPCGMTELSWLAPKDGVLARRGRFRDPDDAETPETVGMFYARLFAQMKQGAYFINIARGRCVVTDNLDEALRSGHLAGAGLEVADPEPLPADHPLWAMPDVPIMPHVAICGTP